VQRRLRRLAALVGALVLAGALMVAINSTSSGLVAEPVANDAVRTVGPLFPGGLAAEHTCTAAVVDSPAGDVIVTAAHCVAGVGAGIVFVPGYSDGQAPFGSWIVDAAYADPSWLEDQSADSDYVFLTVRPAASNATDASVESVVGADALGSAPVDGQVVTVVGYTSGRDDEPVVCGATTYTTEGYPSFDCAGYAGGTSGGPWLADFDAATGTGTITALIGGLNQGGCVASTSYSSALGARAAAVLTRAESSEKGDVLPEAGGDGC
jgi:V8-like Glu-specific endopeptidase